MPIAICLTVAITRKVPIALHQTSPGRLFWPLTVNKPQHPKEKTMHFMGILSMLIAVTITESIYVSCFLWTGSSLKSGVAWICWNEFIIFFTFSNYSSTFFFFRQNYFKTICWIWPIFQKGYTLLPPLFLLRWLPAARARSDPSFSSLYCVFRFHPSPKKSGAVAVPGMFDGYEQYRVHAE